MSDPSVESAAPVPPLPGSRFYRRVLAAAVVLAFFVVVLGATVRLSDAGLGCPDWPGCYGAPTVGAALATPPAERARLWPGQPLDAGRARIEMLHRYAAGTLGLLIVGVVLLGRRRREVRVAGPLLVGVVVLQALLGMWTVTLRLEPLVVTAHLAGGMSVLALLGWLLLRERDPGGRAAADLAAGAGMPLPRRRAAAVLAVAGLLLLAAQIALGAWVAANHATLACQGFPTCNGSWWPEADIRDGFAPVVGRAGDAVMSGPGRIAVHWMHRLGAASVLLVVGTLVALTARRRAPAPVRRAGRIVGLLLAAQIGIGIAMVLAGAPLLLAAGHNAVAALLLLALLVLTHRLIRYVRPVGAPVDMQLTHGRAMRGAGA